MLKAVNEKKPLDLVEHKAEVRWPRSKFLVSQRRICELMDVAESSQRYVNRRMTLQNIAAERSRGLAIRCDNASEFRSPHFLA